MFEEEELVKVKDIDNKVYEAKIVRCDLSGKAPLFLVHYLGWNSRWDKWVQPQMLQKLKEEKLIENTSTSQTHRQKRNRG